MINETSEGSMGNIGTSDAGVLALLADTSRAGNRGGYWGGEGGGGGFGPFASPGSNAVRIDSVGQEVENQADCTRALFGQAFNSIQGQFENATRADENARLCDRISEADQRNTDGQFRAEIRGADQAAMLAMSNKLDKLADCCCDQKVAMCEMENRLSKEMLAIEARGVAHDRDSAERELLAIKYSGHGHHGR